MSYRPDIPPASGRSDVPTGNSDAHIALLLIGGIVVMFIVGFLLLVVSMASDWQ